MNEHISFIGSNHGDLFAAIHKAQSNIKGALRDKQNPHFKSDYASLESTLQAVKKPLFDADLILTQHVGPMMNGLVSLTTVLGHTKSGTAMISTATISRGRGKGEQADGSSISYLRRYTILSLLVVPIVDWLGNDMDDDAEAANKEPEDLPHHPSWTENKEYKRFIGEANRVLQLPKDVDIMERLVEYAIEFGSEKRPSQMDQAERDSFSEWIKNQSEAVLVEPIF